MNRSEAMALMKEYTQNPSLVKHMLAVEAAMRGYARKLGEDEERWGIVGLLHDFDYERWPDPPNHPLKGSEILRQHGYPEESSLTPIICPTVRGCIEWTKRSMRATSWPG